MDDTGYITSQEETPVSNVTNSFGAAPVRTLNVDRANHIISRLTADPSWLADPRTAHAANAIFKSAAQVVGMNLQMERVKNAGEAAKIRANFTNQKINDLSKVTPFVPADDVDGQSELGRLNGMVGTDNFDLQEFAKGVSFLQSRYKAAPKGASDIHERRLDDYIAELTASGDPEKMSQAERHKAILAERGRPKVGSNPHQTAIEAQEADIAKTKASLIQSKKFALASPGDVKKQDAWKSLATRLAGEEAKLDTLKKRSVAPAPLQKSISSPDDTNAVRRFKWTPEGLVPQ